MNFHTIVTHRRPHLDEIIGIWLLKKFGGKEFPGIKDAAIDFTDAGDRTPNGKSWREWHDQGYVLVGIGGGRFDEHANQVKDKKEGHCAASLIAKALEVEEMPEIQPIVKMATQNDLNGAKSIFDIGYIINLLHAQFDDTENIIRWVNVALDAIYQNQAEFWSKSREEFERSAQIEEIVWRKEDGTEGRRFNFVTLESDDEQVTKFARSRHGANAGIVLQKKSSGHVQIHTSPKLGLKLYDLAKIVRVEEQERNGNRVIITDPLKLSSDGTLREVPQWFFHEGMQKLMNGSLTAELVPPTKIPLARLRELVRIGINPSRYEASKENECRKGICTASSQGCSWFRWQLSRCRQVRRSR